MADGGNLIHEGGGGASSSDDGWIETAYSAVGTHGAEPDASPSCDIFNFLRPIVRFLVQVLLRKNVLYALQLNLPF